MAAFNAEQQAFVVERLAKCIPADDIAKEFASRWKDTSCTATDVAARERVHLTADWQEFYDRIRATFLAAPAAEAEVRIAMLSEVAIEAKSRRAHDTMFRALEQIAKEQAGFYGGKGGGAAGSDTKDGSKQGPIEAIEILVTDPKEMPRECLP